MRKSNGKRKLSFSQKIRAGFLVLIVVIMANGVYTWVTLNQCIQYLYTQTREFNPSIEVITELRGIIKDSKTYSTNWVYVGTYEEDKDKLRNILDERYPAQKEKVFMHIDDLLEGQYAADVRSIVESYDLIVADQQAITESLNSFAAYDDPLTIFENEDRIESTIIPGCDTQLERLDTIIAAIQTESDQLKGKMLESFENLKQLMVVSTILSVFIGFVTGFFIVRSMRKTLGGEPTEVASIVDLIAQGKLDMPFSKRVNYGLYGNVKNMVETLKKIVSEVSTGAQAITYASMQLSSSSQLVSSGASDQAASSQQVSASMEEMASNIQQNSDNSQRAEEISTKAMENVEEGKVAVENAVHSMKDIAERVSVIGEIARRTNILALNAAVEAARAGEAGKGFAVVAAEVRKLAENSQQSATEIEELCQSSVGVAETAGKLFHDMVPRIKETVQLVQDINNASVEQNSGATQVNNAIQQLNNITQQNAASSEEMASSSEELLSQADQLKETVGFFDVGIRSSDEKVKASSPKKSEHVSTDHYVTSDAVRGTGINIELEKETSDNEYERFE